MKQVVCPHCGGKSHTAFLAHKPTCPVLVGK